MKEGKKQIMKMELTDKDEAHLINGLKKFREVLEAVGIEGLVSVSFTPDGSVDFVGALGMKSSITVYLRDDGRINSKAVDYIYER